MTPQFQHAFTLISALHERPGARALIEITGLASKQRPVKRYFTDAAIAAEVGLELNMQRYSVFVNVNPRSAFQGREADTPIAVALPLDLQPERTIVEDVINGLTSFGIPPTIRAVSGHGEHAYLLLRSPSEPSVAKLVAERLVKATGSDAIFNSNRIMRLPGSVNWKDPPCWCYLTGLWPERRYDLQEIDRALDRMGAPAARRTREGAPRTPTDPPFDWFGLRERLPPHALTIIDFGEKNAFSERQQTRSEADWLVVCSLVRADATDEQIKWVYDNNPIGQLKYQGAGIRYLTRTIETARRATAKASERAARRSPDNPRPPRGQSTRRFG